MSFEQIVSLFVDDVGDEGGQDASVPNCTPALAVVASDSPSAVYDFRCPHPPTSADDKKMTVAVLLALQQAAAQGPLATSPRPPSHSATARDPALAPDVGMHTLREDASAMPQPRPWSTPTLSRKREAGRSPPAGDGSADSDEERYGVTEAAWHPSDSEVPSDYEDELSESDFEAPRRRARHTQPPPHAAVPFGHHCASLDVRGGPQQQYAAPPVASTSYQPHGGPVALGETPPAAQHLQQQHPRYVGVHHMGQNIFGASIFINRQHVSLGAYTSPELAASAYDLAAREANYPEESLNFAPEVSLALHHAAYGAAAGQTAHPPHAAAPSWGLPAMVPHSPHPGTVVEGLPRQKSSRWPPKFDPRGIVAHRMIKIKGLDGRGGHAVRQLIRECGGSVEVPDPTHPPRYRGTTRVKKDGRWEAQLKFQGQRIYLGRFVNPESGGLAFDVSAYALDRPQSLNFPGLDMDGFIDRCGDAGDSHRNVRSRPNQS